MALTPTEHWNTKVVSQTAPKIGFTTKADSNLWDGGCGLAISFSIHHVPSVMSVFDQRRWLKYFHMNVVRPGGVR